MLSTTKLDQENVVRQRLPAKSTGLKAAAPKTPFRVPLNDENPRFDTAKPLNASFVTPGPANTLRPALGIKTTNAKALAFKTPGPHKVDASPFMTQKTGSPRLRRPKLKVLKQEEVQPVDPDSDVDIEYMPPKAIPLPDYDSDDDFGPDKTFPQLAPENLRRGLATRFLGLSDDESDGLTSWERQQKKIQDESLHRTHARMQEEDDQAFAETERELRRELGLPLPVKRVPQLSVAKTRQRPIATAAAARAQTLQRGVTNPVTSRRYASASSTLGYAQGRAVSQQQQQQQRRQPLQTKVKAALGQSRPQLRKPPIASVFRDRAAAAPRVDDSDMNLKDRGKTDDDQEEMVILATEYDFDDDEDDDDLLSRRPAFH